MRISVWIFRGFIVSLLAAIPAAAQNDGNSDPVSAASIRHLSGAGHDTRHDSIRFSDRAALEPRLEKYLTGTPVFLPEWRKLIHLPHPPENSSPRTKAELQYLLGLQSLRTADQESSIQKQIKVAGMTLGTFGMGEIQAVGGNRPATKRMLAAAQRDMEMIVFQLKASFDRARPTHLTEAITPSIPVPGHPAYPSGHATQAHLLAYLLMELAPDEAETLVEDAAAIAKNREIAGVHYPSDSEAGQLLARQIVDGLLKNSDFVTLMEAAKRENRAAAGR
ncbi:MAG: phosphatase PAP2 family protein [Verrucomicrobiales bacterium]|nr:phosphatase PAP2 family protein [Verrucomicrobiales bacterium]